MFVRAFNLALLLSFPALAGEWPLTGAQQDEILSRRPASTAEATEKQRTELVAAFHFVASIAAREAYWKYLGENWNQYDTGLKKRSVLAEAERLALEASRNQVDKWRSYRSSGQLAGAGTLILKMTPTNPATEKLHEWDRFLNDDGEINYRSRDFGADSRLSESRRPSVDPFAYASNRFRGTPEDRYAKARIATPFLAPKAACTGALHSCDSK